MSTQYGLFKTQRTVDVVFAAGWLAAACVLWFAAIDPAMRDSDVRQQQIVQLRAMESDAEYADRAVKAEETNLVRLEQQIAALNVNLSGVDGLNQRLADMTRLCEDVAEASGGRLKIEQLTPGVPTSGARFTSVPIRLAGVAHYAAAAQLLARIHSQFRDTGVAGFALAAESEAPDAPSRLQLDLVWYAAPAQPTSRGTSNGAGRADRATAAEPQPR